MQIKSWHIVLLGTIVQYIIVLILSVGNNDFFVVCTLAGILLALLLYLKRTQWLAAIIAVSFDVFILGFLLIYAGFNSTISALTLIPIVPFTLLAGIYYLWKRV